ncbi:hypothetical protein [Microcoleus sp. herbarium14]|uniref:hypothetical protein n=1 Tax=Microcoleus sp. herbarium14 TaxID=3055439 RepID=UPI002FD054E6
MEVPATTVQPKEKEKITELRATKATTPTALTAVKTPKSLNPTLTAKQAATSPKQTTAATTVQSPTTPGTTPQPTAKPSVVASAILTQKGTITTTPVTMTASQKTPATQTRITKISPRKQTAATVLTLRETIEIIVTQSPVEITQTLTKMGETLETTIATIIQSTNQTLLAATVPENPVPKTKVKAILKIKSSGIASTKLTLIQPKVTPTN